MRFSHSRRFRGGNSGTASAPATLSLCASGSRASAALRLNSMPSTMNDPFRPIERLERDLGHVAFQLTRVQFTHILVPSVWRPAINAFRCDHGFVICADLAGVDKSAIQVLAESRRLTIRGPRPPAELTSDDPRPAQVLAMEIDQGPFERVLELPAEVNPDAVTAEYREGLLWIRL